MNRIFSLSLILISLTACTKDEVTDSAVEELPPWGEMSAEQKGAYMATDVTPQMAAIFQAYDAEAYADFNCSTCHGTDADANGYAMPSDFHDLAVPPPAAEDGETAALMYAEVVPKMAELLDMDVYDGSNDGLGCYNCHTAEE